MNATLHTEDGRSVLRFERRLAHPVEKVWRAITEPAQLRHWFPCDVEGERRLGGRLRFVFREGEGPALDGVITAFDPPRLFAYTWNDDLLRWELVPEGQGCRLIFTHTFDDRAGAASFAAGWETCLAALAAGLDGRPVEAPARGWAEWHEEYVARFGLLEGTVQPAADGWELRFERQLTQPVDAVWAMLTSAGDTADAPAVGAPPPLQLTNQYVSPGAVTAVEPSALLEYAWQAGDEPAGHVRWALSHGPGGARLVLTQTVPARLADQRPVLLAAWHTHLEIFTDHLRGQTRCPWPVERTEELRQHYAARLQ